MRLILRPVAHASIGRWSRGRLLGQGRADDEAFAKLVACLSPTA
jgi:hypothetical protein